MRTYKIWSPRNQSFRLLLTVWSIFLSDNFLFYREKYGSVTVRVDYGKKENRNRPADDLTLSEFLAIYNDSDRYLVDTLPKEMWDEFFLPNCLLCGGFTTRLQVRNDWYHSLVMTLNWLITLFCGWLGMPTAWGMTGFFCLHSRMLKKERMSYPLYFLWDSCLVVSV